MQLRCGGICNVKTASFMIAVHTNKNYADNIFTRNNK
jgi:hypothetical protein